MGRTSKVARKKVVKPTPKEKEKITARLKHKYPQMYELKTGQRLRKQLASVRSSSDRKALEVMVDKKLKKIYR